MNHQFIAVCKIYPNPSTDALGIVVSTQALRLLDGYCVD